MKAAVLIAFAACTSSSPPSEPSGPHYIYALDHLNVPSNNTEAREFALDLNGDKTVDNQLGMVFASATSMGFDATKSTQAAVDGGALALVADLQTPDLVSSKAAGFTLYFGDREPGNAYTVASDSPTDALLVGDTVASSVFVLGPGELSVRIAFMEPTLIVTLPLEQARVELDAVNASGIDHGVVCGAVDRKALDTLLLPVVAQAFDDAIARDCGTSNGLTCGCQPSTAGATLISTFDFSPKDCTITAAELASDTLIKELLAPDLTIDGRPVDSFGLGFTAAATRLD